MKKILFLLFLMTAQAAFAGGYTMYVIGVYWLSKGATNTYTGEDHTTKVFGWRTYEGRVVGAGDYEITMSGQGDCRKKLDQVLACGTRRPSESFVRYQLGFSMSNLESQPLGPDGVNRMRFIASGQQCAFQAVSFDNLPTGGM